ncbi:EamA family transporter [Flavobacteriaceae bacterium]|jgi:drug/metabolite transporter (DMT)-like permease|nr:EamA family transporter [Flavobacteriaceae bacterium]
MEKKWLYLIVLSMIWGTSFILIKKGLVGLTQIQLGSLRTVLTAIILFSVGLPTLKQIKKPQWKWIALSALFGTFFPAFLFAFAQKHIDSAVASILNSLTPLATAVLGYLVFSIYTTRRQMIGVFIGLLGSIMLIMAGAHINPHQNHWYGILVLIASVGYALNVNILKKYLNELSPLAIATGNFVVIVIPALLILIGTGYFDEIWTVPEVQVSTGYIAILALFGTALAKILFNKMIQISSPVFASSVTYTMPVVAVLWGIFDGERFGWYQAISALIVLFGVYLANQRKGSGKKV